MNLQYTCRHCHSPADETDNYCRICGKNLKPGYGFVFTHTGLILMAVFLGPFALPFVWMSKIIGPVAKWIYSVLLLLMGYYFVVTCYRVYQLVQGTSSLLLNGF